MLLTFRRALRGHVWPTALAGLLVAGLAVLVAASYESIGGLELFQDRLPKAFSAFLKAEGGFIFGSGAQGYLAISFRHPIFLVVLSAFAIASASAGIAREIEHRTILLVLARPITRSRLLLEKALESLFMVSLLVGCILLGTVAGGLGYGLSEDLVYNRFVIASFNTLCLGMAIACIAFLVSAWSSDGGRANMMATAIVVTLFFIDFISDLFESVEWLGLASIFHYYDPVGVAIGSGFPIAHVVVLLSVAVVALSAAVFVFTRRDIAV